MHICIGGVATVREGQPQTTVDRQGHYLFLGNASGGYLVGQSALQTLYKELLHNCGFYQLSEMRYHLLVNSFCKSF